MATTNESRAVPSYGARQDFTQSEQHRIQLRIKHAVAYAKGDRKLATETKNELHKLEYPLYLSTHSSRTQGRGMNLLPPGGDGKSELLSHISAPEGDLLHDPIEYIWALSGKVARKNHANLRDLFADALCQFWEKHTAEPTTDIRKLASRAVSAALYDQMRQDHHQIHSREKARLGEDYKKWQPKITDEVKATLWWGR